MNVFIPKSDQMLTLTSPWKHKQWQFAGNHYHIFPIGTRIKIVTMEYNSSEQDPNRAICFISKEHCKGWDMDDTKTLLQYTSIKNFNEIKCEFYNPNKKKKKEEILII